MFAVTFTAIIGSAEVTLAIVTLLAAGRTELGDSSCQLAMPAQLSMPIPVFTEVWLV